MLLFSVLTAFCRPRMFNSRLSVKRFILFLNVMTTSVISWKAARECWHFVSNMDCCHFFNKIYFAYSILHTIWVL